jgi:hypothetical protein
VPRQIRKLTVLCLVALTLSGCAGTKARSYFSNRIDTLGSNIGGIFKPAQETPPPVGVSEITTPAEGGGAPLYCRVGRGSALFAHNWYDFDDVTFLLHRGHPANVQLSRVRSDEKMTIQALFDGAGQKLIFCPFLNVPQDQRITCASEYALEDDLNDGIKRTFDIPAAVRGGFVTCAYAQENLRPLSVPEN